MPDDNWGYAWWSKVTGPRTFVEEVLSSLSGGRSAVLLLPDTCPWRAEMRSFSAGAIPNHYGLGRLSVDAMRVEPGSGAGRAPFQLLLERYALHDVSLRYRESMDPQDFLVEQRVLKGRIIWLEEAPEKDLHAWLSFASSWRARSPEDGLLVIEVPMHAASALAGVDQDNLRLVDYAGLVSDYSVSLFNGTLIDERTTRDTTNLEQRYLASLMTNLCGGDVEVSEALTDDLVALRDDPIAAVIGVARYFETSRGAGEETHVLGLVRADDRESLERRVWSAQIEVLFPLIETLRLEVIKSLRPQIEKLVDAGAVTQYGKHVRDVEDVELGTLTYLMACRNEDNERLLYVPDEKLREEIHLLHSCRNELAHIGVCPSDHVHQLLALASGNCS